jgi:tRNA threonylcarbamoyladenosine biosynthesis protein TsaB
LENSRDHKPILAIETSTTVARVAVVDARTGARLAAAEASAERHSSNLLRLCVETTEKARVTIAGLGAIACGAGPGSFTGLRVGLAVAKGLALPTDLPLVLISSLHALAMDMRPAASPGEWLLPCLDAGKGQVFAALFEVRGADDADGAGGVLPRGDAWALAPELVPGQLPDDARIVSAGPGAARYQDVLAAGLGTRGRFVEIAGPSADAVAALALVRLSRGEADDLSTAVPVYGRAPDITQPRRSPR